MICQLFENYSNSTLKKLFNTLKNEYFSEEDISKNLKIAVSFGDVERQNEDVAETKISSVEIENLKNNKKANCSVTFNKNIEFNRDVLKEVILHELIHLYQLSQDPERFKEFQHDTVFLKKASEIGKKANIHIRIHLTPKDVIPQDIINNLITILNRDIHLLVLENKEKTIKKVAIVPDIILEKIYDYTKLVYPYHKISILDIKNKTETLHTITNILGRTKNDIYINYKDLDELIKNKELELCFSDYNS